jgi:hypothetical protein
MIVVKSLVLVCLKNEKWLCRECPGSPDRLDVTACPVYAACPALLALRGIQEKTELR